MTDAKHTDSYIDLQYIYMHQAAEVSNTFKIRSLWHTNSIYELLKWVQSCPLT